MKTNVFLGIDIGSISTNLVLLDENKNVISKRYLPTAGRPIEAVKNGLAEVWQEVGDQVNILGVGTTGSGRYMIGELVGADIIKNEITAQAAAAIEIDPTVDTIFEIGGQDSKYISVENGAVIDFTMNKVCAAGTGSFLEEQAEKLGLDIKTDFARLAAEADSPAPLGDRCTVFIESELNNQLQKGASKERLTAGLAESIVKNYLNKVVESRRVGHNIFFQGGVAFNQAVVKAFKKITGKKITVPPHHEVTGAIGIALLAQKEKNWAKSKFKGFALGRAEYQIKTFTCKSCANLCEINMISLADEAPLFYGGRCEKWEKKRGTISRRCSRQGDGGQGTKKTPDLFKERDEIIFHQKTAKGGKRIGIPRVLFFYERFPFWKTFFSSLGFAVVLSSPSNQQIVQAAQESSSAEACFPIALMHGHLLDLLEKDPDYLFLPSLINMEKASEKFNESFNCPYVQALPYFAEAGLDFGRRTKVLSPALEPQRGKQHFEKQLISLARSLGKNRREAVLAVRKAEKESAKVKKHLKDRGRQVLQLIEKEQLPALAVLSRPYNGSDPALNLDIPKQLKDLGIIALPIDYLPISRAEIANEFPNMYWNYGQRLLAAAKFVNRHPALSAVHITNFRCGPDSFISQLIKEIITAKPFLQIEVDEHASDTGVITRLEAFLDSLKNAKPRTQNVEHRAQNTGAKKRVLYLPRMSDHAVALAAAIRASGREAEVLPPSDKQTLELGRKYTSGKECHPFVVTAGDFLKKILRPGFDPKRSAFFMPTASGPCRFGNYHQAHSLIFKRLGYPDLPLVSPHAGDSYSKSMGLDLNFRRRAWRGIIAVDLLTKCTLQQRPHEINKGETDQLHRFYLKQIEKALESGGGRLKTIMTDLSEAFATVPCQHNGHKPIIGVMGELFLRCNPESNADIVRRIEALGGVAWLAPTSEWCYYTNLGYIYESLLRRKPRHFLIGLAQDMLQRWEEHKLAETFNGRIRNLHEPSTLRLIKYASPYLHYTYKGEAVLSIGKSIDYIKKGASGIINIMPFTCMPGTVVSALGKKIKAEHDEFPWLDLAIDGNEGVNLDTRLEAFIHQAQDRHRRSKNNHPL